jgi:hypothetical protein
MSDRAQIERAVDRYLRQVNSDYAVLITGPWGCGKTHFWEKEIAQLVRRSKLQPLYVSLYGLERATDIDRLLLIAQFPVLKNGMFEAFAKLTKSGLDYLRIKLPFDAVKADLSDKVLCFDDLERSSAPISNVLGYINGLVEHDRRKVIVLANEAEITDEKYAQIKEKLFRFAFALEARLEGIPDTWFGDAEKSRGLFEFLRGHRTLMMQLFASSESSNLRSLAAAIDAFKVLWMESAGFQGDKEAVWEAVMCAAFAATFESKRDATTVDTLRVLFQESPVAWWRLMEEEGKEKVTEYLTAVERKYFSGQRASPTTFRSVFDFVVSGVLDIAQFKAQFNHARDVLEQKGAHLEEIFDTRYWNLTDDQFRTIADLILLCY